MKRVSAYRAVRVGVVIALLAGVACSSSGGGGPASQEGSPDGGPAVTTTEKPQAIPPPVMTGPIFLEAAPATVLGTTTFSANGRVQPRGRACKYWFEYGLTTSYGMRTEPRALGPRLGAHYHESWDDGLNGWAGGMSQLDLRPQPRGGPLNGYVRYSEQSHDDKNHHDGVGYIHLTSYVPTGASVVPGPNTSLSGGEPDLRDARVTFYTRGVNWVPRGSELIFWVQADPDPANAEDPVLWRNSNWAFTGAPLTDHLVSGAWEKVGYRVLNDTNAWSYAGKSLAQARDNYVYVPLDDVLSNVNTDFIHVLQLIRPGGPAQPEGSIDFDEFDLVYRNTSVLVGSNGGKLVSSPSGSTDDPATLTDGWRFGEGRAWASAPNPSGELQFTYALDSSVTIKTVQIHQHPEWPSRDVSVAVSDDGSSWRVVAGDEMAPGAPGGPNFMYLRLPLKNVSARFVRVTVASGWRAERWGLGEIEVFGTGATMQADDDWYTVTRDITNVQPGATYHYRLVAETSAGIAYGGDQVFEVPATPAPVARTRGASRIGGGKAKLEGRVSAMGQATTFYFEYGKGTTYGKETVHDYCGIEKGPRHVIAELADLEPGATYHYRVVAENASGRAIGLDQILVAK